MRPSACRQRLLATRFAKPLGRTGSQLPYSYWLLRRCVVQVSRFPSPPVKLLHADNEPSQGDFLLLVARRVPCGRCCCSWFWMDYSQLARRPEGCPGSHFFWGYRDWSYLEPSFPRPG